MHVVNIDVGRLCNTRLPTVGSPGAKGGLELGCGGSDGLGTEAPKKSASLHRPFSSAPSLLGISRGKRTHRWCQDLSPRILENTNY